MRSGLKKDICDERSRPCDSPRRAAPRELDLFGFALAGRAASALDRRAFLSLGGEGKPGIFIRRSASLRAASLRICLALEMRSSMLAGVADGSWRLSMSPMPPC
jgi:hypothetical protein